jgi:hypothetical protein
VRAGELYDLGGMVFGERIRLVFVGSHFVFRNSVVDYVHANKSTLNRSVN